MGIDVVTNNPLHPSMEREYPYDSVQHVGVTIIKTRILTTFIYLTTNKGIFMIRV